MRKQVIRVETNVQELRPRLPVGAEAGFEARRLCWRGLGLSPGFFPSEAAPLLAGVSRNWALPPPSPLAL